MTRLASASCLLGVCLWVGSGCGAAGGQSGNAEQDTTLQDTTLQDTDVTESALLIGVNPTGVEDSALFTPLVTGDELEIEFGFQGLWMVVLAFRVRDRFEGLVTLYAGVRTATETLGEFGIAKQILMHADDGFDYYLNFFLVVTGPEHVGEEAWVEMVLEDGDGHSVAGTVQVVLTGGTHPAAADAGPPPLFPDAHTEVGLDIGPSDAEETHVTE